MSKLIYHITITLLLILITNQAIRDVNADFDPDVLCTYIEDGTQIKDPTACNTYITCVDQKPVPGSCDRYLFYDRNARICVFPTDTTCLSSNPCAALQGEAGFAADPYSCSNFYYCNAAGVGTLGSCSDGFFYNSETQTCIRNFECEITLLPDDYCNIVPDGVIINDPNFSTGDKLCWQGNLINSTCPDGSYFSGNCDYPSNESTTPPPQLPEDVECSKAGIFIADGRTCNGYYYCNGNSDGTIDLIQRFCSVDSFFDPANDGTCVIRTNITCPYDRCVTLGLDYIQLANINGDGCTGFSICQNGEEIGRYSCPPEEYFDEMLQRCTNETISYEACAAI